MSGIIKRNFIITADAFVPYRSLYCCAWRNWVGPNDVIWQHNLLTNLL